MHGVGAHGEHESQWAAVVSIASKIGSTPVTQEMTVDGLELAYLLRDQTGRYWSGKTLNFTQR